MRTQSGYGPLLTGPDLTSAGTVIQLAYRKVIDVHSTAIWERDLFADTYSEFCMQAQFYDQSGELATFDELVKAFPRAEKLHGLVSTVAIGYLRKLGQTIPDLVNLAGKPWIPFEQFGFEIIGSHRQKRGEHRVAITFYSKEMLWLASYHDRLLVAPVDQLGLFLAGEKIQPDSVTMNASVFIHTLQNIAYDRDETTIPDLLS
ncbi:MAG: hypothetical protein KDC28_04815 [Saprospiraceae bacterium]|nr:hypothetical protein [Saprospiraceae bacterium]